MCRRNFFPSQRKVIKEKDGYIFENDGWGRIIKWKRGADRFQFPAQDVENILQDKRRLDKIKFEPVDLDIRYEGVASSSKRAKEKTSGVLQGGRSFPSFLVHSGKCFINGSDR